MKKYGLYGPQLCCGGWICPHINIPHRWYVTGINMVALLQWYPGSTFFDREFCPFWTASQGRDV